MQTVSYRDALRFRLPKSWVAEYLDDGALFREPKGVGVLLLNVVDFGCPEPATTERAVDLLANYGNHEGREILHLTNGNAFVAYTEAPSQPGTVTSFAWEVVHPVAADTLRLAVFSFVVSAGTEASSQVVAAVSMLTKELANTAFLPGSPTND